MDNMCDMLSKGRGRSPADERNGKAKLNAEIVLAIRTAQQSHRITAKAFGANERTVVTSGAAIHGDIFLPMIRWQWLVDGKANACSCRHSTPAHWRQREQQR